MMGFARLLFAACYALTVLAIPNSIIDPRNRKDTCRCIPGDKCWPEVKEWSTLNSTVKGRLTATTLLASACHDPTYNAVECDNLKQFSPAEFDAPYFQNGSCDPFGPRTTPCTLGNYASYSIKVTEADDVAAAFDFARKRNIRLTIKNTGHAFLGKSAGKGSLELWTHNLKDASFIPNYGSRAYSGAAVKLGAGLTTAEAYLFAHQHGVQVAGSSCATVGIAGGYTSGGGHNPLMGHYGLAADNPEGDYRDLYWALSGGGAGTFGVVLSLTTKAHTDVPTGGARMTIPAAGISADGFWDVVLAYYSTLMPVLDQGTYVTALLTQDMLVVYVATALNRTAAQVSDQLQPFQKYFHDKAIPYTKNFTYYDNFYDHMNNYLGPYPNGGLGPVSQLTGGHLARKDVFVTKNSTQKLVDALRTITSTDSARCKQARTTRRHAYVKDTRVHFVAVAGWDYSIPKQQMVDRQHDMATRILPILKAATPGKGTYLNEANFEEPDWQDEFYGPNYPRLSKIKRTYDADQLLYARTAVGSEYWSEDGDGRLCTIKY
ncbi:putative FAD-binding PCMH-type domain-containing protein [Seiridium cardinale]|uniref:FAD-binding PCMH-type domain-containing protein n=1 Tax=Seiridium cardinale TaxID=138064 RepID=A0ABR2XAN6_9PEZI